MSSAITPVVTTGNPRLEDRLASVLTPDQLAALAGTVGAPNAANPFVTTSDSRLGASGGVAGLVSITNPPYSADPTSRLDATSAFVLAGQACWDDTIPTTSDRYAGKALCIPPGAYRVTAPLAYKSVQNLEIFGYGRGSGNGTTFFFPSKIQGYGAIDTVLDLHGFATGTIHHLTLTGVESSGHPDSLLYYHKDSTTDPASPSTDLLCEGVWCEGVWTTAAYQIGAKSASGFQQDLTKFIGCVARGRWSPGATEWHTGFHFGSGQAANCLNHTAISCDVISCGNGVEVDSTNVIWVGGTVQSNQNDFNF